MKLWDSKLSGKKKLAVDEDVIVDNKNSVAVFNYSFQLDSYYFNLVQLSDTQFDLKINDIFFSEIMECEQSGELKKKVKKQEKEKDYEETDDLDESKNKKNYTDNDDDDDLID